MDSEDGCGIVCGVGEWTEFRYDRVRSEFVLGDFPGMMVGNCVPLQLIIDHEIIQNLNIPPRRVPRLVPVAGMMVEIICHQPSIS